MKFHKITFSSPGHLGPCIEHCPVCGTIWYLGLTLISASGLRPRGTDYFVDPVTPSAHRVKREVRRALVDGALDSLARARVTETVDELLAGKGMGEDADIKAVGQTVLQNTHLVCQRHKVVFRVGSAVLVLQVIVIIFILEVLLLICRHWRWLETHKWGPGQ